jgi:glycosyltransferase involved in cell wall biosynthesis
MPNTRPNSVVDIVIPYYKSLEFLREAIESVLKQTMPDFTLLIIDDSPNDVQAKDYVASLGDPRITYCTYESNKGINAAFELAHKSFKSPWGIILGQDDRLLPNYLEKMVEAASKETSVALIQSGTKIIGSNGQRIFSLVDLFKLILFKINFFFGKSTKVQR